MSGEFGYAGSILKVDLSSGKMTHLRTMDYADRFVGGRGVAARIYWDEVSPDVRALEPGNCLIFMTGPLAGIKGLAGPRWEVCGKSPAVEPEQFCYGNLGGRWGSHLKFAGFDGLIIKGKAEEPVYLAIQNGRAELKDASGLWGKGSIEVREILNSGQESPVSVMAIGPAGENVVTFATILADNDASGSGGFGAVMGSKKLKAVMVRGSGKTHVANPEELSKLTKYARQLKKEPVTPELIGLITGPKTKKDPCYGCPGDCFRLTCEATDGTKGKFMCGSALFYQELARKHYGEWNEVPFYANKLCDQYGLDTRVLGSEIALLHGCHMAGILTDSDAGLPLSKLGSFEFIESLVKKISFREGFGDALAQGPFNTAELVGRGAKELLAGYSKKDQVLIHDPRVYITTALLYAMEPRTTMNLFGEMMHGVSSWMGWLKKSEGAYVSTEVLRGIAKRFFGGELAVDFSTYNGKALAARKIQDREYIKDSLVLCAFTWPITIRTSGDHIGDPTIESKVFSAVTGKVVDEEGLYKIGEAIFNLQRAILAREGHVGRASDTLPEYLHTTPVGRVPLPYNPDSLVPGKDGRVISRKGAVVDRDGFERMKDEYYRLREWDVATGLQTKKKLQELGLGDIAIGLEQRGLLR